MIFRNLNKKIITDKIQVVMGLEATEDSTSCRNPSISEVHRAERLVGIGLTMKPSASKTLRRDKCICETQTHFAERSVFGKNFSDFKQVKTRKLIIFAKNSKHHEEIILSNSLPDLRNRIIWQFSKQGVLSRPFTKS
jgi:hypothetical protein